MVRPPQVRGSFTPAHGFFSSQPQLTAHPNTCDIAIRIPRSELRDSRFASWVKKLSTSKRPTLEISHSLKAASTGPRSIRM
jgi:hypothetical protein